MSIRDQRATYMGSNLKQKEKENLKCYFTKLPIALHSLHYTAIVIVLVVSRNFIMRFIHTFTNIIRPPGSLPPAVPLVKQNMKLVWPKHPSESTT